MTDGNNRPWHYYLLWLLALVSLALSVFLFVSLLSLRQQAREELAQARERVESMEVPDYELPVHVDETLPISFTVPFSDTFVVPISTTIPISSSVPFSETIQVPINTVIPVNTTVSVPIPAIGNIRVPIPIVTSIPVNLNVAVPISRSIPVDLDIPVNLTVDVPVESEVPVQAEVPVQLDFPVALPLEEMGFEDLLLQVQEALDSLSELVG